MSIWSDLRPRVGSGLAMLAVGGAALWAGGMWFSALAIVIVGLSVWELVRMIRPGHDTAAIQEATLAAAVFAVALYLPLGMMPILLGVLLVVLVGRTGREPVRVALYAAAIFLASFALVELRDEGVRPALFLVAVVVVTDVAGYFAGRIFGGPGFWPAISPKKTWSGTVAGWIGAILVGLVPGFALADGMGLVIAAPFLSFASQMGDIAESALKRRTKVKDSSNLIPGHGGVLDRFDGMVGAALMVGLLMLVGVL
ncbi:MAG: phosphatidate cytidylyltransferase [Rhodobacterales bacterium]|nr:MAG: phosphatidate cytidylyltransferase [Rhodobacterales bacterium]